MKSYVTLFFFIGILMITVGYINQKQKCPPPIIEYRYIPRTFEQQQDNPVKISQVYSQMFEEPSPWVAGFKLGTESKGSATNKYFISQE
jgi:hypothetical protein